MTPQERQVRILDFIERYQRDRQDAPTIREVVMGSGVSSYSDIQGDIEALLQRRLVAWVPESVSGSEPFSSRQVKSSRDPAAAAAASPGPAAPPPAATRRPLAQPPRRQAPTPPPGAVPRRGGAGLPPPSRPQPQGGPGSAPPGWGQAPGGGGSRGQAPLPPAATGGRAQGGATGGRAARPHDPWGAPGGGGSRVAGPLRGAGQARGGLGPWLKPWHLAAAGFLVAGTLIYRFLQAGGALPPQPAIPVLGKDRSLWMPGLLLVWVALGLVLARSLERRHWQTREVLAALLWGGLGGMVYQAYGILSPDLVPQDLSGLQRLGEAALETLPILLALRYAPFSGAALLAQGAALTLALSLDGNLSFLALVLLLLPLHVLPAEVALYVSDPGPRRRLPLVGAALGALNAFVGRAFFPVAAYLSPWVGALVGAGMGALLASLAERVDGLLASRRAARRGPLP